MARKIKQYTNPFVKAKEKSLTSTAIDTPNLQVAIDFHQQGKLVQAEEIYRQLLAIQPNNADALNLLGVIAYQTGEVQSAVDIIGQAIELNPNVSSYHANLGVALKAFGRFEEAVKSYDEAIDLKPDSVDAYFNRGNALKELKELEAAVASYDKAIELRPDYAEAYSNRGVLLKELKQFEVAVASFNMAIGLKPDFAEAYSNRGLALEELQKFVAAVASYDKAILLNPKMAGAYSNRGLALQVLKKFEAAVDSYDKAIALKPDFDYLFGLRQHAKMMSFDWHEFEIDVAEISFKIQKNLKASTPFVSLALPISLSEQRKTAEIWSNDRYPYNNSLGPIIKSTSKKKIRIGYFSADFHTHPVSNLMLALFEQHDKLKFELIAFSFGPDINDEIREKIIKAFDRFIDVRAIKDKDVAALSRKIGVDIAIDLGGHTLGSRTGIFSYRAAPIQVNYLGYPGTMGAEYMDYLVADEILIPEQSSVHYLEKIAYMPNSYLAGDPRKEISKRIFTRQELGLPESSFIFCCFNNAYKITPHVFDIWAKILHRAINSHLWLISTNETAKLNLINEFKKRGLKSDRLIFGGRIDSPSDHLARFKVADLFLDTFPYNAHATAVDALWAGLPILTCMGESFASRVAGSLLHSIGLPELATSTQNEYETMAIDLATNAAKLKVIRDKLISNRLESPLFDTKLFIKQLEIIYTKMYERYQADLLPNHIHISP